MARADLSAMLGRLPDDEPAVTPQETTPAPRVKTPARRKPDAKLAETPAPKPAAIVDTTSSRTAGYLSFERKETRLRADQYSTLTLESRRLNRAKGTGGERITENTLIRVAIDLLLAKADQLAGATEAELRKSVGL